MLALYVLKEKLISIIQQYPLERNQSTTSLDSASPVELQPEASLQETLDRHIRNIIKESISSPKDGVPLVRAIEDEDHTDGPVLRFILKTILLLDSIISKKTILDVEQMELLSRNLVDLLTTLNTLYMQAQEIFMSQDEFKLRGFIVTDSGSDNRYSYIADRISLCLADIIGVESVDIDSIPEIVKEWINIYRNEVMFPHLVAEYKALTLLITEQAEELAYLRQMKDEADVLLAENQRLTSQLEQQQMALDRLSGVEHEFDALRAQYAQPNTVTEQQQMELARTMGANVALRTRPLAVTTGINWILARKVGASFWRKVPEGPAGEPPRQAERQEPQ